MEISDNSSWLIYKLKILLRNAVFLLNTTLWSLVLYFSIDDDEIAAFLSYVSVTLTILTTKYYLWEVINNNKSVAYFIDCSSKTLILAGISLVLLPQFWNTAFYSLCLGIVMQTAKREIQVRMRNEYLYLCMQVAGVCTNNHQTIDEMKLLGLQYEAHNMELTKIKTKDCGSANGCCMSRSLNEKNVLLLKNATEDTIEIKQQKENIKETQNFPKNFDKFRPDVILSDQEKVVIPCSKENNFLVSEESDKNLLHNDNPHRLTVSLEAVTSTLKLMEYYTESNVVSNYGDPEEIQSTEKFCTLLQNQLLNLEEFELKQCPKLESTLNENNEKELKINEEACVNSVVKNLVMQVALSDDNLQDFSQDDVKQVNTERSNMESETKNTAKIKLFPEEVNSSNVYTDRFESSNQKCDSIRSYNDKNSLKKSESKCKTDVETIAIKELNSRLFIKNENLLSLNNESKILDITLQDMENVGKVSSQTIDSDVLENLSQDNENVNSEAKCRSRNCTSVKTTNIQPEKETATCQLTCSSEKFSGKSTNLNACLQYNQRIGEALSTDFAVNRKKNLTNEINIQENSPETKMNLNSEVKCLNMNCTSVKTKNIQPENYFSQKKLVSQQVNNGNLETVLRTEDKVRLEYPFEQKRLHNSVFVSSSILNESVNVEKRNNANESLKETSDDKTLSSNVDDVVNRIDMGFIYALGFNVAYAEYKF